MLFCMAKSTICTIRKNKEAIKGADDTKKVSCNIFWVWNTLIQFTLHIMGKIYMVYDKLVKEQPSGTDCVWEPKYHCVYLPICSYLAVTYRKRAILVLNIPCMCVLFTIVMYWTCDCQSSSSLKELIQTYLWVRLRPLNTSHTPKVHLLKVPGHLAPNPVRPGSSNLT